MGTETSDNSGTEQIPNERPKVYPCADCNNEFVFTIRGLESHKRTCTHQESCLCKVCSYKKPPVKKVPLLPVCLPNVNCLPLSYSCNKRLKTIQGFPSLRVETSANDAELNHKQPSSNASVTLKEPVTKAPEGRSESSDSSENAHSDNSQRNPKRRLVYVKPLFLAGPQSKLTQLKLADTLDPMDNHHNGGQCNRKLFCCICNDHIFWEMFGTHVLQHSIKIENNNLVCPQCNQSFRSPNLYLMHFPQHLEEHICQQCDCTHPKCSDQAPRAAEHSYAEEVSCYICHKTFDGNQNVLAHLKQHCKEFPYTCDECNRSFRQTGNLQRHMLAHRGEKPHKCNFCSVGFSDPATLRNHVRTHTKEAPYACKVCGRAFTQIGNLKRHMALHVAKEKVSSVLIVSGGFNEKSIGIVRQEIVQDDEKSSGSELLSDQEAQKTDDPLPFGESEDGPKKRGRDGKVKLLMCNLCGKKYAWQHDLKIHFRTHTGEKPYKCELCDKQFAQSGAVRMHKVRHHNKAKLSPRKSTPRLKITSSVSTTEV